MRGRDGRRGGTCDISGAVQLLDALAWLDPASIAETKLLYSLSEIKRSKWLLTLLSRFEMIEMWTMGEALPGKKLPA